MRKFLIVAVAAGLLSVSASAQIPKKDRAAFNAVADAVSSAETCRQHGFDVDVRGIMQWRDDVRDAAVTTSFTPAMAEAAIQTEIDEEVANQMARFRRAQTMSHAHEKLLDHRHYWSRRCKDLAKDELTAPYFVRAS